MNTGKRITTTPELGEVLRAYRKSRGLTQAAAAGLAGVGERFLSELERGKNTAEIGLVLKVCERFGLVLTVTHRAGASLCANTPEGERDHG